MRSNENLSPVSSQIFHFRRRPLITLFNLTFFLALFKRSAHHVRPNDHTTNLNASNQCRLHNIDFKYQLNAFMYDPSLLCFERPKFAYNNVSAG